MTEQLELPLDYSAVTLHTDADRSMTFCGPDNAVCGRLDWSTGIMKFEGEVDECAKIFFNAFLRRVDEASLQSTT